MKKLLLSTALLSTVAIAYSTNTAEAAPIEQETKIGVTFQGDDNTVTDKGVGNIVMGKSPSEWKFENLKTNLSGGATQLADSVKRAEETYVMINDDRSDTSDSNKPTPWELSMKFNKLNNGEDVQSDAYKELNSKLTLTMGDIYEYYAGAIVFENTKDEDYTFPAAKDGKTIKYDLEKTDAGVASLTANKSLVLSGGAGETAVLTKAAAGLDKAHSKQNMGTKQGGQGYLVSFKTPVLSIQDSTIGLDDKTYSSELVYSLDLK